MGGIAVTVREIVARSRNLARFDESQRTKSVSARGGFSFGGEATSSVLREREPTLEERVELLEAAVKTYPKRWEKAAKDAANGAQAEAKHHADALHRSGSYELDKVKVALREALTGGSGAMVGVGLLVAGVVLQGVGSLLATTS